VAFTIQILTASSILLGLLNFSLQELLAAVTTLQLIVHFPLFLLVLPANAGLFFDQLMKVAAFDVIETTPYWDSLLSLDPTVPVNQNFEALGYESLYFLQNLGSLVLIFAGYFLCLMLLLLLKCCSCCECCKWLTDKVSRKLLFGPLISLIQKSYMVVIVSCLINLQNLSWTSYGEITQSVATIFYLVLFLAFPIVESLYLAYRFDHLGEEEMQARHGAFIEDLDLRRGRLVLLQPVWFKLRRLILGVAVVLLNKKALWQFLIVMFTVFVQIIVLTCLVPFKSSSQVGRELVNEAIIMVVLYHLMCFSNFVPDLDTRFILGYSLIAFVVVWLLGNMGWITWKQLKSLKFKFVVCWAKCWHRQTKKVRRKKKDERKDIRWKLLLKKRKGIIELREREPLEPPQVVEDALQAPRSSQRSSGKDENSEWEQLSQFKGLEEIKEEEEVPDDDVLLDGANMGH